MIDRSAVARAIGHPPREPARARLRGEIIQRLHKFPGQYSASWDRIYDNTLPRCIRLSDEFQSIDAWSRLTPEEQRSAGHRRGYDEVFRDAAQKLDLGLLAEARRELFLLGLLRAGVMPPREARLTAWLAARSGWPDGPERLATLSPPGNEPLWLVNDYLYIYRFGRLAPDTQSMRPWISRGDKLTARDTPQSQSQRMVFQEHRAAFHFATGKLVRAKTLLARLRVDDGQFPARLRIRLSALALRIHLSLGELLAARRAYETARQSVTNGGVCGDEQEFAVPWRALLLPADRSRRILYATAAELSATGNPAGEARCLMLAVRLYRTRRRQSRVHDRLVALSESTPLLRECCLMQRILANWDRWTDPEDRAACDQDPYWGL
jgi:hypothetical protein